MINDRTSTGLFPASAQPPAARPQAPRSAVLLAREALDTRAAQSGDPRRVQREIEKIMDAVGPPGAAQERAADGSLRLTSMNAVFALSVIDRALGGRVLPRLYRRTTPSDFRTSASLAALLVRLLAGKQVAAA